jgi:sensor domain CHASE-containing protein
LTFKVGMISLGVLVALGILIICGIIYWRRERNSGEKNDQNTAQKTDQYHGNGEV